MSTPKAIKLDLPWDEVEAAANKEHRRAKNLIEVLVLTYLGKINPQPVTGTVNPAAVASFTSTQEAQDGNPS